MKLHELDPEDMFVLDGLLGMEVLQDLANLDKSSLRFPTMHPYVNEALVHPASLFEQIRKGDVFVHLPFDSFRSVETFVASAAEDPDVIGIKQTLYRVGSESPIVESLLKAAEAGKQVAVMVELKARFDESNNLIWARALERAGVHVTYGFAELKTHCKLCLVVRRERGGIRSYAHIGTGNYNPSTGRLYTDFGLFTDDPEITQDIAELFNVLTGLSRQTKYRKLLVAPSSLREGILERIRRETAIARKTGKGLMLMKMNALVDPEVTDALYEASQAGVQIDLVVRGICTLRAGVPGLSDNVRVRSIVGRFLEHSRLYYFDNDGEPEAFIGSADLMRRNLDHRVETLVPIQSPEIRRHLRDLVTLYQRDDINAWVQLPDGEYLREQPTDPTKPFRVQDYLISHPSTRSLSVL
jgi:polyphosphate kinase